MGKLNVKTIIFWGAVWGIFEATLGWLLHLMHFRGEVMILYPIGLLCMMMATKQTGKVSATIKVSAVAALVKLVNLFMQPTVPVFHITNPAVAIFLEGFVTWAFCMYIRKVTIARPMNVMIAAAMVFASICLFRGWQIFMDAFITYNPSVHKAYDVGLFLQWGWRSFAQGLMLVGAAYAVKYIPLSVSFRSWSNRLAFPLFLMTVLLNILIPF